jgi:hypothetical protein
MDQHIAVLGFLLTATVFSVGFLSARVHSSFDACELEVNGQTWRIRDALLRGERMSPSNLQGSLTVIRRSRDPVAMVTRVINSLLFAATMALSADAYLLIRKGEPAPKHAFLLISLVLVGSLAVTLIGELDVRKVTRDQRAVIANSLPGRIIRLSSTLDARQYRQADERLAELRDTFPDWGLLAEIQAYSALRQGHADEAYAMIRELVARTDDLYLSHIVGSAAAIGVGDGVGALNLLRTVQERRPRLTGNADLIRAASVYLGHVAALLEVSSPDTMATSLRATGRRWPGRRRGSRSFVPETLSLDPREVPETRQLLQLLAVWDTGVEVAELVAVEPEAQLLAPVVTVLGQPRRGPAVAPAAPATDAFALETQGLLELAQGDSREALRTLERGVRLSPAQSRLHWAVAVASERIGWAGAAAAALKRAETLDPESPIVRLTHAAAVQAGQAPALVDFRAAFRAGVRPLDRLHIALLGLRIDGPTGSSGEGGTTLREQFTTRLLDAAVSSARTSREAHEAGAEQVRAA